MSVLQVKQTWLHQGIDAPRQTTNHWYFIDGSSVTALSDGARKACDATSKDQLVHIHKQGEPCVESPHVFFEMEG